MSSEQKTEESGSSETEGEKGGQWLIRTAKNRIVGPYTEQQLTEMLMARQLSANDEICLANSYWIYLHEVEHVREILGIDFPKEVLEEGPGEKEEITETSMVEGADEDPTDPSLRGPSLESRTPERSLESHLTSYSMPANQHYKLFIGGLITAGISIGYLIYRIVH